MEMEIRRARIGEMPPDGALELDAIDKLEADHHAVAVERAHRERSLAQLLRHAVNGIESLLASAHEDGKPHPLGRLDRVVLVVEQDQLVAGL
jgi:hypothetical protein